MEKISTLRVFRKRASHAGTVPAKDAEDDAQAGILSTASISYRTTSYHLSRHRALACALAVVDRI
jgi:hypothetical protein